MKCTGLKAVSYPDTRHLIKGSTVKTCTDPPIFIHIVRRMCFNQMIMSKFRKELEVLINQNSLENGSNTPDFILAEYLENCLKAFDYAVSQRTSWYRKEKDELNDRTASANF